MCHVDLHTAKNEVQGELLFSCSEHSLDGTVLGRSERPEDLNYSVCFKLLVILIFLKNINFTMHLDIIYI